MNAQSVLGHGGPARGVAPWEDHMTLTDRMTNSAEASTPAIGQSQHVAGRPSSEMDQARQPQQQNVSQAERTVSLAAGSILALLGLSRKSLPGLLVAGVGGSLVYRGVTGHCGMYESLGIDTAREEREGRDAESEEQAARRGIHVENAFLINRSPHDLYAYWRNFENLPRIMQHLEEVRVIDDRRSHWAARLPRVAGGKRLEWDAEVTRDDPNSLIAWRSVPGSDVETSGRVRFAPAMGDRGTEVHVFMEYVPPGGILTALLTPLLSKGSKRLIREDMRNFKRIMETGDIPTIIGQPHGTCMGHGERYTEGSW
jgi:uncharacterized membrane protein